MRLSKSKYCNAVCCNKMLWLDTYRPEVAVDVDNDSILRNGKIVGEVAKGLFLEYYDISFCEELEQMIKETNEAIKKGYKVITEASFAFKNCFCSVDILKLNGKEVEIYEVKSSTEVKDIYLDDISYQVYVLVSLGYEVNKACLVHINSEYERHGDLELDKLFLIEDVTDKVYDSVLDVEKKILEIQEVIKPDKEIEQKIGMHCMKPYPCPYFSYCTKDLPEKNVFDLRRMTYSSKFKFYDRGVYTYEDLLKENIKDNVRQQIEFSLYHLKPVINKEKIKEFLERLYYPLYFLDFETFQQPIPLYDGVKPYMQIPFQYSIHCYEKEGLPIGHKVLLAEVNNDPRIMLAEMLVQAIPKNACVLAYNMMFEKMVIKNLADIYDDLRDDLLDIYSQIDDLMIPFRNREYYTEKMEGSYSIKYVLPALFPNEPSLDYHNLELIHHGGEAMDAYARLGSMSKEEQEKVRHSLLKYCELDTYAMVKIYDKLKEVVQED